MIKIATTVFVCVKGDSFNECNSFTAFAVVAGRCARDEVEVVLKFVPKNTTPLLITMANRKVQ